MANSTVDRRARVAELGIGGIEDQALGEFAISRSNELDRGEHAAQQLIAVTACGERDDLGRTGAAKE
jgi:hypothetical protein